jgi:ArsR family transcriptional regulator, virulence genes transcriptional regulator
MSNPKRIHLLRILESGEKTVAELEKLTGLPQGNLSQHLALLRQLGLLKSRRAGLNVYYSISDPRIVEACNLVRGCISERLRRSQVMLAQVP